ncbi:MAG TPA: hypothetical protein VG938_00595, partial [Verrucomicrobiae bacterium]|nr:hypothetical protein [Verrucomicrobiae bacterium]
QLTARHGFGALPTVLPSSQNLKSPYAPFSSQPWLKVALVNYGQVNFTYPLNLGSSNRTGNITVLGQSVPITQAGRPLISPSVKAGKKSFQLSFTNLDTTSTYTILTSTNIKLSVTNWTVLGTASNIGGVLQFLDTQATNDHGFYLIRGGP